MALLQGVSILLNFMGNAGHSHYNPQKRVHVQSQWLLRATIQKNYCIARKKFSFLTYHFIFHFLIIFPVDTQNRSYQKRELKEIILSRVTSLLEKPRIIVKKTNYAWAWFLLVQEKLKWLIYVMIGYAFSKKLLMMVHSIEWHTTQLLVKALQDASQKRSKIGNNCKYHVQRFLASSKDYRNGTAGVHCGQICTRKNFQRF